MADLSGAEALVKRLRQHKVDTVFGLPGGQLDHMFDAMYREGDGMQVIHSRHEQGVAYMAYGYARSTGREGVFAVVPGPGLLNAAGALCTAWGNNAQVLCISGQIPLLAIDRGYGDLHEIPDQLGMISHITKSAARIEHPTSAPAAVDEAFRQLNTGRPRPVEIEMPMDTMAQRAEVPLDDPDRNWFRPAVDEAGIEQALELLKGAKRPMIIVGGGAIDAAKDILEIAEKLQAPVLSKRQGKGIISARHYLNANSPMGHALWADCDVVLAVGTRMKEQLTAWGIDDDLKIIRIDIDPVEIRRIHQADVEILGDAALSMGVLNKNLSVQNESRETEMMSLREKIDADIRGHVVPQMAYLDVIREVLPDDGLFVDEVTQCGFVSWYGFPVYKPRQHVTAAEMGTLGFGFATALGVAAGNPGKKTVQISGDGGFMFTMQELSTAVAYNIDLVTIIFNDNAFANVQRQQDEWFDGRRTCSDLHNPDFARLAEVFGATGMKAHSPEQLRAALEKAFATSGPVLIEVPVTERMPTPWKFIMMPQNRGRVCT